MAQSDQSRIAISAYVRIFKSIELFSPNRKLDLIHRVESFDEHFLIR